MDFTYGSTFLTDAPEAYETLLLDAMLGDASLFTRADEVEAAWGMVTPLDAHLAGLGCRRRRGGKPKGGERQGTSSPAPAALDGSLQPYEAGTWGREAADRLLRTRRTAMAKAVTPHRRHRRSRRQSRWRWHVRTSLVRETTEALSSLWVRVAQRDRRRLAERRRAPCTWATAAWRPSSRRPTRGRRVAQGAHRTSVLTLVVVAPTPETVDRAMAAVTTLATRHPSRAIILAPSDPDGPADFDAHVYAACQVPERGTTEICTEEIVFKIGGELAQHLASHGGAARSSTTCRSCSGGPTTCPSGGTCSTSWPRRRPAVLVDSGSFRGDGRERLHGHGRGGRASGLVVHDISWMRLMLWRELLAGLFDHPLLLPELRRLTSIRVDVARPGSVTRLARAPLFIGWLAAMLDWRSEQPLPAGCRRQLPGHAPRAAGARSPSSCDRWGRPSAGRSGPGSLVRVELEASRVRTMLRVRVTRQSDHLLATADWNGARWPDARPRLEPFDEMPFLAEALDRTGHDRVFELALERAVRLTAALVPPTPGAGPRTGSSAAGTA